MQKIDFTETINEKPSYFIYKIWEGFFREEIPRCEYYFHLFSDAYREQFGKDWDEMEDNVRIDCAKYHTIRRKLGTLQEDSEVVLVVNKGKFNEFIFTPTLFVHSIQQIYIIDEDEPEGFGFTVNIDGYIKTEAQIEQLALNDGFESLEAFKTYFKSKMINGSYEGKIIHWTKLKY